MQDFTFHNDEPVSQDRLKRDQFASAFSKIATSCDTPMVIGLYGTWGVGKTTLMKLIDTKLKSQKYPTIWFDAWQHQFDENPALAFLHTFIDQLDLGKHREFKKWLKVIGCAFGSWLLKTRANFNTQDIRIFRKNYEEERFLICEERIRLKKNIENMIKKAREKKGDRIIFFIDDLDRCMPAQLLNLLETLKLYLNLSGCVYFIGADRSALMNSISYSYEKLELSEADYLDKIVQLPFTIPPIEPGSMNDFIEEVLSEDLNSCLDMLGKGLGDNPRQIKRFVNMLNLNHLLAKEVLIPDYDPKFLAFILIIQLRNINLYQYLARHPNSLRQQPKDGPETKSLFEESLEKDDRLKDAFSLIEVPAEEMIRRYIYLTRFARISSGHDWEEKRPADLLAIIQEHKRWQDTRGYKCVLSPADLHGANLSAIDLEEVDLSEANLCEANLNETNLKKATLHKTNLEGASLRGANLIEAMLCDARLMGADFTDAILKGANLGPGDLGMSRPSFTNLSGAILINADLEAANLHKARLRKADLTSANFKNTRLDRVDFWRSNLTEARNITADLLSHAKTLYKAKLDPDLEQELRRKYPHLLEKPTDLDWWDAKEDYR